MKKILCIGLIAMSVSACGTSSGIELKETDKRVLATEAPVWAHCGTREVTEVHYQGEKSGVQYEIKMLGGHFQVGFKSKSCDQSGCSRGGLNVSGVSEKIPEGYEFPNIGVLFDEGFGESVYFCEIYKEEVLLKKTKVQRAMTSQEYNTICSQ